MEHLPGPVHRASSQLRAVAPAVTAFCCWRVTAGAVTGAVSWGGTDQVCQLQEDRGGTKLPPRPLSPDYLFAVL